MKEVIYMFEVVIPKIVIHNVVKVVVTITVL